MAKVAPFCVIAKKQEQNTCNCSDKNHSDTLSLDTLAQLRKTALHKGYSPAKESFQKRARAKLLTDKLIKPLIELDSPLKDSYWSSWHCTKTVLQDGRELKTQYCNQRWCLVCNRIRTAKLINGYKAEIDRMRNPYFITLTVKNVKGEDLKGELVRMKNTFRQIADVMRRRKAPLIGIRKTEVTYNHITNEFHPHFHCIIDGCYPAFALIAEWIKRYGHRTSFKGQDIRPATDGTTQELFKYFTKLISKDMTYHPQAMDTIFQAMKGKRVFQPFGGIKKQSEDIEVKDQTLCDWRDADIEIWQYEEAGEFSDWYNAQGEPLTDVQMTPETMQLVNRIEKTPRVRSKTNPKTRIILPDRLNRIGQNGTL